jgi:hypothetical protein
MPVAPTLTAVRLERTRDVLREIARSMSRALPIAVGIAGPLVIAVFGLLAWAGAPVMHAPTMGASAGTATWCAQTLLAAWPLWALRARLLPAAWCVQLRGLPIARRAILVSDLEVAAVVLSPVALAYVVSAAIFTATATAWWRAGWPLAIASAAASWAGSCVLGAAALAWQRATIERGHPGRVRRPSARPAAARNAQAAAPPPMSRASIVDALLWRPSWRGAMNPGGATLLAGVVVAVALAFAWTRALAPVVPGAAWAFAFSALAVMLTERAQRAMEAHVAALEPMLVSWPVGGAWRWQARVLPVLPAVIALCALAGLVVAGARPWRALPLVALALTTLATHAALVSVPASNREAHVSIWALGTGLATAFGSELW